MEELPANLTLDSNSTFPENIECIPYYKSNATGYYPALVPQEQTVGWIVQLECELPTFPVPRLLDSSSPSSCSDHDHQVCRYHCCRSGTLPQQRYFPSDDFYVTASIELVLYSFAAIASALIAVGLLVPLLVDLLQQRRGRTSNRDSSSRSSSRRSTAARRSVAASAPPRYSTYNLYLVYLAIPDLVYALLRIWIDGCMLAQKSIPNGWENGYYYSSGSSWPSVFLMAYIMANLVMNAVISYEVLVLLRSSRAVQRIKQPDLRRANLQGLAVYAFSVLYAVGMWVVIQRSPYFGEIFVMNGRILQILYVLGVHFVVWWRGYLPPPSSSSRRSSTSPSERAMRTLALYFSRIVYVFIGVWVPGLVFMRYAHNTGTRWANYLYLLLPAIQAIVSTGMILTKPDVRRHAWNLLTLYHAFQNCRACCFRKKNDPVDASSKTAATARASLSVPKKFSPAQGIREDDEGTNGRNDDGTNDNNNDHYAKNDDSEDNIKDPPSDVENSGTTKTLEREEDTSVSNYTSMNDASVSNYTTSSSIEIIFPSTNSELGSHSINITHPTMSHVDG